MRAIWLIALLLQASTTAAESASLDEVLSETGQRYRNMLIRSDRMYLDATLDVYVQALLDDLNPSGTVLVDIVDDVEPYALAVPANLIVVSTGLLLRTASVHELRGLLAHELAHHLERHHERQWRMAREEESKLLNRVPWIGARRRASTMNDFSHLLELEADAGAVSLLRAYDSGQGLLDLLGRLQSEAEGESAILQERLESLNAQTNGAFVAESDDEARYREVTKQVRSHALGELLRRRQFAVIERLKNEPILATHGEPPVAAPLSQGLDERVPLEVQAPLSVGTSSAILMDGWALDVPRDWQRVRRDGAVVITRDGAALHRIDARCMAPSRAFYALGEPAAEQVSDRVAQVVADVLRQVQDFRGRVAVAGSLATVIGELGYVEISYRDARGLEHVVTSAHVFDGAYFCELRWFTPRRHFHQRDRATFLAMLRSLRRQ